MQKADFEMFLNAQIQIMLRNNFRFRGFIKELKEDCLIFDDTISGPVLLAYGDIRLVKFYTDTYPKGEPSG